MAGTTLPRENRRRAVLWIILAIIVPSLAWHGLSHLLGISSGEGTFFDQVIQGLLIALALIWLLGERLGNRHRLVTCVLSLLIFTALAGCLLLGIGWGDVAIQILIFFGIMSSVLLLSFVIAGLWSRKKPGPVRFAFKLATCIFLTTITLVLTLVALLMASESTSFSTIALKVLMSASACAGIMIALLLPMELVLLIHPFWRRRFEAIMGFPTRKPTPSPLTTGVIQNATSDRQGRSN